jgi:transposase
VGGTWRSRRASGDDVSCYCTAGGDAKKKTVYASELDAEGRAAWWDEIKDLDPEQIVDVDETSTSLAMTPRYARAPQGERAVGYVPRNYGKRTTLIAALTTEGIGAAMTIEGAVDTVVFRAYVEQCLVPTLRPGQVVCMDNLSSHKDPAIETAISAVGCRVVFLPPYSPDYAPIEHAFSKIKEFLRRWAARTPEALDVAIADALNTVTAEDARGWFKHCGYEVSVAI